MRQRGVRKECWFLPATCPPSRKTVAGPFIQELLVSQVAVKHLKNLGNLYPISQTYTLTPTQMKPKP